jgi:nitrate/nitrite transporter NarK
VPDTVLLCCINIVLLRLGWLMRLPRCRAAVGTFSSVPACFPPVWCIASAYKCNFYTSCACNALQGWVHMAAVPGTGAVSLAAVNSVGKAGGFLGPLSFGLILHATGSYVPSILLVGGVLLCGGAMALLYTGERSGQRYQKLADDGCQKHSRGRHQQQQHGLVQLQSS